MILLIWNEDGIRSPNERSLGLVALKLAERKDTREFSITEKLRVRYNGKIKNSV